MQPLQRTLTVAVGVNLLEALRANDVPVSYSCLSGRCGTCRCKVITGPEAEAGQDGQDVLACQTFLTESCTVEIPEPDEIVVHTAKIIKATVDAIEDSTHDIKRIRLKPAKPIAKDWTSLAGFRAYLCGAPPMVEATTLLVRQMGVLSKQIYADSFSPVALDAQNYRH